jgi:small-conductance mechanosensitive channel
MFETRSQSWREAGLLRQISPRVVRRARAETLVFVPLFVGIVLFYTHREAWLGKKLDKHIEVPIQIVAVAVLMVLGWVIARAIGRAFGPALFRRMDPATAGTVGFLIRLITIFVAFIFALKVAKVESKTLAAGSAVAAIVLGLAAQQTLGNVIAGAMLLSAAPFRVGDKVRLQGGALGGPVEGVVSSLGLFYTTLACEDESVMVPNSVVLNALMIYEDEIHGGS